MSRALILDITLLVAAGSVVLVILWENAPARKKWRRERREISYSFANNRGVERQRKQLQKDTKKTMKQSPT
jgi:hypothetical protein